MSRSATLGALVNVFLRDRRHPIGTGELAEGPWHDYYLVCAPRPPRHRIRWNCVGRFCVSSLYPPDDVNGVYRCRVVCRFLVRPETPESTARVRPLTAFIYRPVRFRHKGAGDG